MHRGAVAVSHWVPVKSDCAPRKLQPPVTVGGNDVLNGVRFVETARVDPNILVDRDGSIVAIRIKYQSEAVALFLFPENAAAHNSVAGAFG